MLQMSGEAAAGEWSCSRSAIEDVRDDTPDLYRRSEPSYYPRPELPVVVIRKPTRSHHEVVSYLSTGLGTELLSCNSACLWCKSPLSSHLLELRC